MQAQPSPPAGFLLLRPAAPGTARCRCTGLPVSRAPAAVMQRSPLLVVVVQPLLGPLLLLFLGAPQQLCKLAAAGVRHGPMRPAGSSKGSGRQTLAFAWRCFFDQGCASISPGTQPGTSAKSCLGSADSLQSPHHLHSRLHVQVAARQPAWQAMGRTRCGRRGRRAGAEPSAGPGAGHLPRLSRQIISPWPTQPLPETEGPAWWPQRPSSAAGAAPAGRVHEARTSQRLQIVPKTLGAHATGTCTGCWQATRATTTVPLVRMTTSAM